MTEVVLHLGLHKTATGTLQRQFFPACADCNLLTASQPEVRAFVDQVTRRDPLFFSADQARELIEPYFDERKPNVISNESFSGPPYAGVIEAGLDHRAPVLANLRECFPDARAILVLRRQDDLARSFYRQYLKSGGTREVRRFYGLGALQTRPLMTLDRFRFAPYVEAVKKAFPAGVLLLAYEEFVSDQASYLGKLTDFIGIANPGIMLRSENSTRLGFMGMEVSRALNHLFRSSLNHAGMLPSPPRRDGDGRRRWRPVAILHDKWPGRPAKRKLGRMVEVGQEILDTVREDNAKLDESYGLGLGAYGYY